jgi:short-subunit dehydrogenase
MNPLLKNYGPWAIITGASSGIGKCFAYSLASVGFNLVLVARDYKKLTVVSTELTKAYTIQCKIIVADLSTEEAVPVIIQETKHIPIGILINNAGYSLTGNFTNDTIESQTKLMKINSLIPMQLCHHYGLLMKSARRGAIINISSVSGMMALPKWNVYAASKAFLISFSKSLWYELKPFNIAVLVVCPGATKTNFHTTATINSSGGSPEIVVNKALKSLGKKPLVIIGFSNYVIAIMMRLFPTKIKIKLGSKAIDRMHP